MNLLLSYYIIYIYVIISSEVMFCLLGLAVGFWSFTVFDVGNLGCLAERSVSAGEVGV
jgi:hypothetical protein